MASKPWREYWRSTLPWPIIYCYRKIRSLSQDLPVLIAFLFQKTRFATTFYKRCALILKCYRISYSIDCPHMESEMIKIISAILSLDPSSKAVIVEAGSYKGGSTAKISLAAAITNRKLYVFDSFEGMPNHKEIHGKNIFGGDAHFPTGSYCGTLDEVKENVRKFGAIEACTFFKGWFENTMPKFREQIGVAYIDVDLESSTKICLKFLYPLLLKNGGVLFSHDGHLPWVTKLFGDETFWKGMNMQKPDIQGLGKEKLVSMSKIGSL